MPDIAAIRRELEATTPYSPEEITELLDNIEVNPAEVERLRTMYFNRFNRQSKQCMFGQYRSAIDKHVLLVRE